MTRWRDRILLAIGTAFGLGYAPIAPGTAGALLGVGIYVLIAVAAPAALQVWLMAAALLATSVACIAWSPWAERYWQKKDPGTYVLDEVAGFLVTALLFHPFHPPGSLGALALTVVWAFLITRILDIIKPPPARQLERLPAGWGILADDVCSSLYAAGLLHIAYACLPRLFGAGA